MNQHLTNTSDTGKAVRLNGDENNFSFTDSESKIVILIDDDQAVSNGTYSSYTPLFNVNNEPLWIGTLETDQGPKYVYNYMDMGICIGHGPQSPLGYTTLGRKKVFTTGEIIAGSINGEKASVMHQDYIRTTGYIQAQNKEQTKSSKLDENGLTTSEVKSSAYKTNDGTTDYNGITKRVQYLVAGGATWHLVIVNGLIVEQGPGA